VFYFANPCGGDEVLTAMRAGVIGYIDTPAQGNARPPGVVWCADNGCFGKGWPGYDAWLEWLGENACDSTSCVFATAPDVVGDAQATLARSLPWLPKIRALGYPAAFVAQNGADEACPPWGLLDVLFVGGSPECLPCGYVRPTSAPKPAKNQPLRCPGCTRKLTEWKLGDVAAGLVSEAKRRGKRAHMGRVNSFRRYQEARAMGCDTADGTFLTYGPKKNLPQLMRWVSS
jgi:hypothetical protein